MCVTARQAAELRQEAKKLREELTKIREKAEQANRDLNRVEAARGNEIGMRIDEIRDELDEYERIAHARRGSVAIDGPIRVSAEPLTYEIGGRHSFFRDVFHASQGDVDARDRLQRHRGEMAVELRALDSSDGSGGEFIPPLWAMDEWVALARAGRPFANAVRRLQLPPGTDSINIPVVAGAASTAVHSDGGTVDSTDPTTDSLSVGVKTIAGQVDVSRQLFDRSVPGIDQVLFADLTADYATKLDVQCLNGSGIGANAKGVLNDANIISVTFTSGDPFGKIVDAVQQIHTNRFLPPTGIVMHPRRWGALLDFKDTSGRPIITPYGPVNAWGQFDQVASENLVGHIQGLPVIVDASIPTTLGGGDEDAILVGRLSDAYLWEEAAPRTRVFEEVLSGNLQIRLQVYGYFAFTSERYPKAFAKITGSELATPTF